MANIERHRKRFLRRQKQKSENTAKKRRGDLKQYEEWLESNGHDLTNADGFTVEDYIFDLNEQEYASPTIETRYISIKLFYEYLVDVGVIDENPAKSVDINRLLQNQRTRKEEELRGDKMYITAEEKEAMCENVPDPKLRNELLLRLLWQTGIRKSEVREIKLDDINRKERSINIYAKKTNTTRVVYYHRSLNTLLDQWIDGGYRMSYLPAQESPYLFLTGRSEQVSSRAIQKAVRSSAENAGIQEVMYEDPAGRERAKITPHTLRHSYAVAALKNGIPTKTLQELLGHQKLDTTEQYLQLVDDDLAEMAKRYNPGGEATN